MDGSDGGASGGAAVDIFTYRITLVFLFILLVFYSVFNQK